VGGFRSALKNVFQNVDVALREAGKDESSISGKWQVGGCVSSEGVMAAG
jgi:hypothetical protein